MSDITDGTIIAIDGKQARRSYDKRNRKSAIHMVSAWASHNGIVLEQQKTDDKSNKKTAMPKLLKLLEIKGCIITLYAMGCQKEVAKTIQYKDADYVLALKGNQGNLSNDVILESLMSIKRSGASAIVTYFAIEIAKKIK